MRNLSYLKKKNYTLQLTNIFRRLSTQDFPKKVSRLFKHTYLKKKWKSIAIHNLVIIILDVNLCFDMTTSALRQQTIYKTKNQKQVQYMNAHGR